MPNYCPHCGAPIDPAAAKCEYCNNSLNPQVAAPAPQPAAPAPQPVQPVYQQPVYQQPVYPNPTGYGVGNPAINPAWPIKNKLVAALLAIFLGSLGIHKFYLGNNKMGVLYLVFFWTYIPGIIGFIEGILYLCSNDENFQLKHRVRL